jgi:large subunit ribosomal protein L32e
MAKADIVRELTKIKGIGKTKAELLYEKGFNSIDKLKKATINQLVKVEGITETMATNIKNQFKEKAEKKKVQPYDPKKAELKKPKTDKKIKSKAKLDTKKEKEIKKPVEEEIKEEPKEEIKEEEYKVKKKPILTKEQKEKLILRKNIKRRTPNFFREEWFRYKRIQKNWRKPDGITSKMRINLKYRPSNVRVGFRGPKETRGLHPSGFKEVIIKNVNDLENIDPKTEAARISSSVGTKKRIDIEKKAEELEIRILNV